MLDENFFWKIKINFLYLYKGFPVPFKNWENYGLLVNVDYNFRLQNENTGIVTSAAYETY